MDVTGPQPNIARAIERSRAAREKQRSRRRRLGLAAGVAALLSTGTVLTIAAATGSDPLLAAVSQARSLADLLAQRSPGERTGAMLTKMKASRALARARAPLAPAKAEGPSPMALAEILLPAETAVPVELATPVPFAQISSPELATFVTPGGGGGPSIVTPGGSSPGGGGGSTPGGSTPIVTPPTDHPVPTPAVPEPATWAMMLLGFGLIGWRVRRSPAPSLIAGPINA